MHVMFYITMENIGFRDVIWTKMLVMICSYTYVFVAIFNLWGFYITSDSGGNVGMWEGGNSFFVIELVWFEWIFGCGLERTYTKEGFHSRCSLTESPTKFIKVVRFPKSFFLYKKSFSKPLCIFIHFYPEYPARNCWVKNHWVSKFYESSISDDLWRWVELINSRLYIVCHS